MEGLYVNAQVIASRVGWPARQVPRTLTHKPLEVFDLKRKKKWRWGHFFDNTTLPFLFTFKFSIWETNKRDKQPSVLKVKEINRKFCLLENIYLYISNPSVL